MTKENLPRGSADRDDGVDNDLGAESDSEHSQDQSPRALLFMEWSDALKSVYNALFHPLRNPGKQDGGHKQKNFSRSTAIRLLTVLITGIILCWLLTPAMYSVRQDFDFNDSDLGRISQKVIKADRDYDIPDTTMTQRKKDEAWNSIPPIYEEDITASQKAEERVRQAFLLMRNAAEDAKKTLNRLQEQRKTELERIAELQIRAERARREKELAAAAKAAEEARAAEEKAQAAEKTGEDSENEKGQDQGQDQKISQKDVSSEAAAQAKVSDSAADQNNGKTPSKKSADADKPDPKPETNASDGKKSVASEAEKRTPSAEEEIHIPRVEDLPPIPSLKSLVQKAFAEQKDNWRQRLETSIPDDQFNALAEDQFSESTEVIIEELIRRSYIHGVVESRDMILSTLTAQKIIKLQRVEGQSLVSESALADVSVVSELREIPRKIHQWVSTDFRSDLSSKPAVLRQAIQNIAERQIRINLTYDQQETEERRNLAAESVRPVVIQLKKGEKIIGDGEKIEARHLIVFSAIRQQASALELAGVRLGIAALAILFLILSNAFAKSFMRRYSPSFRDEILMAITLIAIMALANLTIFVGDNLREHLTRFTPEDLYFVIPMAAGAMLIRVILSMEAAFVFTLVSSALIGFIAGNSLSLCVYTLAGSLTAITCLSKGVDRTAVFKSGMWTAAANLLVVTAISLIGAGARPDAPEFIAAASFAVISGALLSPALVTTFSPICERFGYTTDMKLTELNNLNHPLIKRLMTEAPGTYNHSSQLTTLVEAGAEAVGANPLLAKVCALYHDIGKLTQPTIFAENQVGVNPLSGMKPAMASKSIQSHVTEGFQLAKDYGLPAPVADATLQHHGTRVTGFFFKKALNDKRSEIFDDLASKCAAELGVEPKALSQEILAKIDEESDRKAKKIILASDFSYPGPIPQSIEVALVMLADVVEATTRASKPSTLEELREIIRKSVDDIFKEGQLAACDLTLRDLDAIQNAFFSVLKGSNHSRPKYPSENTRRRITTESGGTLAGILSRAPTPASASSVPSVLASTPVPLERIMPSKPPSAVPSFVTQTPTLIPTPVPRRSTSSSASIPSGKTPERGFSASATPTPVHHPHVETGTPSPAAQQTDGMGATPAPTPTSPKESTSGSEENRVAAGSGPESGANSPTI